MAAFVGLPLPLGAAAHGACHRRGAAACPRLRGVTPPRRHGAGGRARPHPPPPAVTMRASADAATAALAAAVEAVASTPLLALAVDGRLGQQIVDAATAVEAAAAGGRQGARNARSGRLVGTWALAYTNSSAVVGNAGLTGAGRLLPGVRLDALRVGYALDGRAWAEERLRAAFGVVGVRNRLTGTWAAAPGGDGNTVEQTYAELVTQPGGITLRADSKAVVDVTYLDEEWRIARAPKSRDLFVFRREPTEAADWAWKAGGEEEKGKGKGKEATREGELAADKAPKNREARRQAKKK